MSTNDVPGSNPANRDILATGAWAEHDDGSLIFVEGTEGGDIIYVMFDVALDPPVQYRDAMKEIAFKKQFSWKSGEAILNLKWTWHDKKPMPWDRVMSNFPAGQGHASAVDTMSAAARVAQSLDLRAGVVEERYSKAPIPQIAARSLMTRISDARAALRK